VSRFILTPTPPQLLEGERPREPFPRGRGGVVRLGGSLALQFPITLSAREGSQNVILIEAKNL